MVQGLTAILFDLDGTLADTAPDLGLALNTLRSGRGYPELPLDIIRPQASNGVRGLLGLGFGLDPEDADYALLRDEFLQVYMENICNRTRLFDGMSALLAELESMGMPWGIVTNKPMRFTLPLVDALGLNAQVVVGGDSCAHQKPHPEPLLYAAERLAVTPGDCIYLGDDRRDVDASLAAGMMPIVAYYGYLGDGDVASWGAHGGINHPLELLKYIS